MFGCRQPGRGTRFASEPLEEFGVDGKLRVEQFDGHAAVEQAVVRLPDDGHAAPRDLADQAIAAAQDAVGALQAHSRPPSSTGSSSRSPWRRRISRSA